MVALTTHEVCRRTGLSRCTIWRLCRLSQFPQPRQLSPGRRAWLEADVDEWLAQRARWARPEPAQLAQARVDR
jgi:prophage regulatory protein